MATKKDINVVIVRKDASRDSVIKAAHKVFGPTNSRIQRTIETALDHGTVVALVTLEHFQLVVYTNQLRSYEMEIESLQYVYVCEHPWYEERLGEFGKAEMANPETTIREAVALQFQAHITKQPSG